MFKMFENLTSLSIIKNYSGFNPSCHDYFIYFLNEETDLLNIPVQKFRADRHIYWN
jgi:hypothetical protein